MPEQRQRRSDLAGRRAIRSPGRPPVARREDRQRFWDAIARGLSSEDAAVSSGVSPAVGVRWFVRVAACRRSVWRRCRVATCLSRSEKRSRSFGPGAPGYARSPDSSAETRRRSHGSCAVTRRPAGGRLDYRATTAQWHADRQARRPKVAKLAANDALRQSVQDRLAGTLTAPSGTPVSGPRVRWIGRRHGRRQDRRWAGSVSTACIATAACPVMVIAIPPPERRYRGRGGDRHRRPAQPGPQDDDCYRGTRDRYRPFGRYDVSECRSGPPLRQSRAVEPEPYD
jgi:hypothetical protein